MLFLPVLLLATLRGAVASRARAGPRPAAAGGFVRALPRADDAAALRPRGPLERSDVGSHGERSRRRRRGGRPVGRDARRPAPPLKGAARRLDECGVGQCYNLYYEQCFHETSQECLNPKQVTRTPIASPTARPTPRPTSRPTIGHVITEHPLLVLLQGLDPRFYLSATVKEAIVDYVFASLREKLGDLPYGIELLDMLYQGELPDRPHALPLLAVVRHPADISDFILSYIVQIIVDNSQEIVDDVKALEAIAFQDRVWFDDLGLATDTYDPAELVNVRTRAPSPAPTPGAFDPELQEPRAIAPPAEEAEEAGTHLPWWVWAAVGGASVFVVAFYICYIV